MGVCEGVCDDWFVRMPVLPLVWVLELPLVREPDELRSAPVSVVTLVSVLPWLVVSVRDAQPTMRAAAASMQISCFIIFLILSVVREHHRPRQKRFHGGNYEQRRQKALGRDYACQMQPLQTIA